MPAIQRSTSMMPRLFNYPTQVSLKDTDEGAWNQICVTGSFVSTRYGKFQIGRKDLADMKRNFDTASRTPPELPIDYDHIGLAPQRPGDGVAAGWVKALELRDDGDTLWARCEFTVRASEFIRNKEYKFISPSFVKDHHLSDGRKVGTALVAIAITNFPFLTGMKALTLYSFSALGDLGVLEVPMKTAPKRTRLALSEVGQCVMIKSDVELPAFLTEEARTTVFEIGKVKGQGDDEMVWLALSDRKGGFWWPSAELDVADAPAETPPPMAEKSMPESAPSPKGPAGISASDRLNELAMQLHRTKDISFREAVRMVATEDLVTGFHQEIRLNAEPIIEREAAGVPTQPGETFTRFVTRIQAERQLGAREAFMLCSAAAPELAARYEGGETR